MATINDISNAAQYRGTPYLGGSVGVGITIDSTPLQRLATFQYYRDRDLWQKKQIDDRAAAKEIADLTAYDISSPMKGYTDYLLNKKNEALDFLKKNPNALSIDKDKEGYIKFRQIVGDFERARKAANTSEVIYNARKTTADKAGTDLEKQLALDYLDESVNDLFANGIEGALNNTLESARPLNPKDYEVPKVATSTIEYIGQDPNDNKKFTIKSFDINKLKGDAFLAWSGANKSTFDENSPEFKRLSPKRQELARRENELVSKKMAAVSNLSNSLNGMLQQQKQIDPNFKPSEITGDFTGDTLLDTVKLFNKTNAQIRELNALIKAGSLKDKTGVKVTKLFPEINIDDGVTPDEYITVEALAANGGSLFSLQKDVQPTDNALRESAQEETARHNRATENLNRAELKLAQDKWKETMVGGETVKNGAFERAKRIYNDMKKLSDSNGVISPDKIRQLNAEQLKYLGIETVTTSEAGVPRSVFQPLTFEEDAPYAIQLINGEIKVLKDAKKGESGRFGGQWDNTKSTNIFNVATNILNEELQKAGAKELNSYMAIDLGTGGVTENTSGGRTSKSVSTKTYKNDTNEINWKNNGDGTYTYIPTGQKVDSKTGKLIQ